VRPYEREGSSNNITSIKQHNYAHPVQLSKQKLKKAKTTK